MVKLTNEMGSSRVNAMRWGIEVIATGRWEFSVHIRWYVCEVDTPV